MAAAGPASSDNLPTGPLKQPKNKLMSRFMVICIILIFFSVPDMSSFAASSRGEKISTACVVVTTNSSQEPTPPPIETLNDNQKPTNSPSAYGKTLPRKDGAPESTTNSTPVFVPETPPSLVGRKIRIYDEKTGLPIGFRGALCVQAQLRGWGNELLAILGFLRWSMYMQQVISLKPEAGGTGYIDLRTALPCHLSADDEKKNVHCVNHPYPCMHKKDYGSAANHTSSTSFASTLINLFVHIHECPNDDDADASSGQYYNQSSCRTMMESSKHVVVYGQTAGNDFLKFPNEFGFQLADFKAAKKKAKQLGQFAATYDDNSDDKRPGSFFQLNASFVEYVLKQANSTLSVEQLARHDAVCPFQARFGDGFMRRNTAYKPRQTKNDRRLCGNVQSKQDCFQMVVQRMETKACPDASKPIYMATDYEDFRQFFCNRYLNSNITVANRTIASQCPSIEPNGGGHIHDADLDSLEGQKLLYEMLTDWVVLALTSLSKSSNAASTTFVTSANFPYFV